MILAVDPKKSPQSPQQQLRRSRSLNNDDSEGMGIMDSTSDEKKKNGSCDGCFYDDGTGDDGESDITLENDDDDVDELDRYQKQQHLLDRSFYDSSTNEFGGENFYQHSSLSSSSNNNHVDDAERLLNQLMDEQDERRARAQQMQEKPSPVSTATTCLTQEEEGKEAAVRCSWDLIPQPQLECCASVVSISSSVVLRRRIQGQGDMQDWGISSTPLEEDHSRIKQQQQQLQQQPKLVQQQSRKPASLQRRSATTPGPHMISNDSEVLRIIPAIASQIMMRSKSSICLTDYHQYQYEHSINMNNSSSSSDKVKIHPLYKQKSSSTSELGGGCQETAAPGHHHHARSRRRYPSQQQVEGTAGPQDLAAAAADGGSSDYNAGDSFTRTHRRSSSVLCGNTVYVV
jgi:hypothetical protein